MSKKQAFSIARLKHDDNRDLNDRTCDYQVQDPGLVQQCFVLPLTGLHRSTAWRACASFPCGAPVWAAKSAFRLRIPERTYACAPLTPPGRTCSLPCSYPASSEVLLRYKWPCYISTRAINPAPGPPLQTPVVTVQGPLPPPVHQDRAGPGH